MLWSLTDEAIAMGKQSLHNMDETSKRSVKNRDQNEVHQAMVKAGREYNYLFELAMAPSRRVVFQEYRHKFYFSTLVIMNSRVSRIVFEKCPEMTEDQKIQHLDQTKVMMTKTLSVVLVDKLFTDKVSNHYFEGVSLLFKEQQEHLESQISLTRRLCEHINDDIDFLEYKWEQDKQHQGIDCKRFVLDFDELDALADSMALELFEQAKQEAMIEVYDSMGQKTKANQLLHNLISSQV